MNITITPTKLKGTITPPPSKSQAHRLILAAALAGGESVLSNMAMSQDIQATLGCMQALGAKAALRGDALSITGIGSRRTPCGACMCGIPHLDCGESGSTLRFLMPVALAVRGGGRFTGRGRLMERPQEPYFELFREKGISCEYQDGALVLSGRLAPGVCRLRGDVSSQFVTGLLYALPLLEGDSRITLTTPLESRGYVDMTLEALERFGIRAECPDGRTLRVPGGQTYRPCRAAVESDYSQAAFWLAAAGLGSPLTVEGLDPDSTQGDRCAVPYFQQLAGPGRVELDIAQCPDLAPALAVRAALRPGQTARLVNAGRLRLKECDRLAAIPEELNKLGGQLTEGADFLEIRGVERLLGGVADSHNDHRIAMMLAVAATRAKGTVTIRGAESVAKSYPDFWEVYESLGGRVLRQREEREACDM